MIKEILSIAANFNKMLHAMLKTVMSRFENGSWVSPHL